MSDITQIPELSDLPASNGEIWVTDPKTNQRVNVQAFLTAMNDFEPGHDAPLNNGALDSIKRIVRFLSLIEHDSVSTDFTQLSNVFNDLWRLWDMFETTSVVKGNQA